MRRQLKNTLKKTRYNTNGQKINTKKSDRLHYQPTPEKSCRESRAETAISNVLWNETKHVLLTSCLSGNVCLCIKTLKHVSKTAGTKQTLC